MSKNLKELEKVEEDIRNESTSKDVMNDTNTNSKETKLPKDSKDTNKSIRAQQSESRVKWADPSE